jgi:UTP--glucose-1-phosphate uridylyltransferase
MRGMSAEGLAEARRMMTDAGVHPLAVKVFAHYYGLLERGDTGTLAETAIDPVESMQRLADLQVNEHEARNALDKTVVIKLNGGLGTSMGMDRAKSLVPVRGDKRFLDLIAEQTLAVRERLGVRMPVMFMNSFRTRRDTLAALAGYPKLAVDDLPLDFLQNQEPKLRRDDLTPVLWPNDPALAWCPPGHGDLYTALRASGTLDTLTAVGYRYAFVSNADNLGAVPDHRLAGWFASSGAPFAAETCRRTSSDRKGGHLAVRKSDGRFVVRETAQTTPEDEPAFGDIERHRYFNTNSLWLDLPALSDKLDACDGVLPLPLIRNIKHVDPSEPSSPEVIQIETAMGAAIELFDEATAIEVERSRFLPVKTTNDLLVLRSDVYRINDQRELEMAPERDRPAPFVDLDPTYYKLLSDFDARFPAGPPSLIGADRFVVRGDVVFDAGYAVRGDVTIDDQR